MVNHNAAVLMSGGLDSLATLSWALAEHPRDKVRCIYFEHGSLAAKAERLAAERITERLTGTELVVIDVRSLGVLSQDGLLYDPKVREDTTPGLALEKDTRFVRGRNILFYSTAMVWAANHRVRTLYAGINFGWHIPTSQYPDATQEFVQSIQDSVNMGLGAQSDPDDERAVVIRYPFYASLKVDEIVYLSDRIHLSYSQYAVSCVHPKVVSGTIVSCGKCFNCECRGKAFRKAAKQRSNIKDYMAYEY